MGYGPEGASGDNVTGGSGSSDQMSLDGIARGCGSGGDLQFAVDRSQMVIDRSRADDEAFGDLRVRQSLCHQTQDLDLPGGEPAWSSVS